MEYMAMAGWKTEDMLGGIEGIMSLAAASGEDLATTSDIVTDALTAFGLSAQDSGHFADILAAASSNANTNVRMMGETFKYCAPIAGALGFSAEDVAEAIGLMANAGIKSTQAGTALRTIMNNLSGEVKITGAALGEVTIDNLLKALEMGVITKSTKERLEQLEGEKAELENQIALEKLKQPTLTEEFVRYWLERFRGIDTTNIAHRKLLIDVFLNTVYLYNDTVVITFNYKEDTETINFSDIEAALQACADGSGSKFDSSPKQSSLPSGGLLRFISLPWD